jgi:hypothetical protein
VRAAARVLSQAAVELSRFAAGGGLIEDSVRPGTVQASTTAAAVARLDDQLQEFIKRRRARHLGGKRRGPVTGTLARLQLGLERQEDRH